jgi:maleate isomerase
MAALRTTALIVPSSNTVMERDLHRALGEAIAIGTTRIFLEQVTREAETAMLEDELPRALRLARTLAPDVVVFGCTSAGSLGGVAHDSEIGRAIARDTGAAAVTVVAAVLDRLRGVAPRQVAVFTPYVEDLTRSVASCIAEAGYGVATMAGMGLVENRAIGSVPPEQIVRFVRARLQDVAADCVFLSCTNWQAVDARPALEAHLGLPVVTSNQAVIEAVRALAGAGSEELKIG